MNNIEQKTYLQLYYIIIIRYCRGKKWPANNKAKKKIALTYSIFTDAASFIIDKYRKILKVLFLRAIVHEISSIFLNVEM